MPRDGTLRAMNALHRTVLAATRGRVGRLLGGMPVLELTTTGRHTGLPRRVLLTAPVVEGDTLVVVASRGGDDRPPAWLLNLEHAPDVEVRLLGEPPRRMRARVAAPAERERLWPRVTARWPGYAGYQSRTARVIPLVLLEPVDS